MFSEPTVFENYVHDIYVDDQLVELSLWDTAGKCTKFQTVLDSIYKMKECHIFR